LPSAAHAQVKPLLLNKNHPGTALDKPVAEAGHTPSNITARGSSNARRTPWSYCSGEDFAAVQAMHARRAQIRKTGGTRRVGSAAGGGKSMTEDVFSCGGPRPFR